MAIAKDEHSSVVTCGGEVDPAAGSAMSANRSPGPAGPEPVARNEEGLPVRGPAPNATDARMPSRRVKKWITLLVSGAGLAVGAHFLIPWARTELNTVSTDDAYINGHVTYVAPRVSGQVSQVLVEDNQRVRKGDLLVRLDKEPYEVVCEMKRAGVVSAQADLAAANAQVHAVVGATRATRFTLQRAIENVKTEIARLHAAVATLNSARARLDLAQANLHRGEALTPTGAMSKEDLDQRRQMVKVNEAAVDEALQNVRAIRVGLGLSADAPEGRDLTHVPPGLDQNFSTVQQTLAALGQSVSQLGYLPRDWEATPAHAIKEFYQQDPAHDFNRIVARMVPDAPAIKQAEARLLAARRELAQAELNLRYCDVVSEIDGVVTRRNVNSGNNVQAGQSLMAVRSLTEIWIDANFKETQLADLRIGQRAVCTVDMYGHKKHFEGRITGFTMGTGQTLALLPPQNATGNFVKIVQRLPVRIELTDYDPEKAPLFVGLSVEPRVYYQEKPTGPHAGEVLQPISDTTGKSKESNP